MAAVIWKASIFAAMLPLFRRSAQYLTDAKALSAFIICPALPAGRTVLLMTWRREPGTGIR